MKLLSRYLADLNYAAIHRYLNSPPGGLLSVVTYSALAALVAVWSLWGG